MTFKLKTKTQEKKRHVTINLPVNQYNEISIHAKAGGVSIKEFCRQAIAYALYGSQK